VGRADEATLLRLLARRHCRTVEPSAPVEIVRASLRVPGLKAERPGLIIRDIFLGKYAIDARTSMAYFYLVTFVETPAFTRRITEWLEDDEYARLQGCLAAHPDVGDVMAAQGASKNHRDMEATL
jgi:hypothetical protein